MSSTRRQMKKKHVDEKADKAKRFDFTDEDEVKKGLSGSDDEAREDEAPVVDKVAKKRPAEDYDEDEICALGNDVMSMVERFGVDINKTVQAKKKRVEALTKNYMKGRQQKMEQLWNNSRLQRQKLTQQYSQQFSTALQQWEAEAQRAGEQEERLNTLLRQQQKVLQQARLVQNQKLKTVKKLYEQFVKNMDEMEKSHESFLQGAQQELREEMAALQKKILTNTQQEEMATIRKSLHSMLF